MPPLASHPPTHPIPNLASAATRASICRHSYQQRQFLTPGVLHRVRRSKGARLRLRLQLQLLLDGHTRADTHPITPTPTLKPTQTTSSYHHHHHPSSPLHPSRPDCSGAGPVNTSPTSRSFIAECSRLRHTGLRRPLMWASVQHKSDAVAPPMEKESKKRFGRVGMCGAGSASPADPSLWN